LETFPSQVKELNEEMSHMFTQFSMPDCFATVAEAD